MISRGPKAELVTNLTLEVFRLHGRLLAEGDELVRTLNLTSSRWQILGPVALAGQGLSAPQIAAAMGLTRQGVQKQLNRMVREEFFRTMPNPRHERSPLYELTAKGRKAIAAAMDRQSLWATALGKHFAVGDLECALDTLTRLNHLLPQSTTESGDPK